MNKALLALGLALLAASPSLAAPSADKVDSLPQMGTFKFNVYSGYLKVNDKKQLHYLFAESQQSPSNDPVIIWFNGGPGCSSMLGFTTENGPFIMKEETDVFVENPYSWNKEANMLYIEAPAGVGYSWCQDEESCTFNDTTTADDNLVAVLDWFNRLFPEYKNNDLWVSGESYGGIYVPYLASRMDEHNSKAASGDFKFNLKGFMVGNGVTNWTYDTTGAFVDMGFMHGLYDYALRKQLDKFKCTYANLEFTDPSKKCLDLLDKFSTFTDRINVYDVYRKCYAPGPELYGQDHFNLVKVGDSIKAYRNFATTQDYTPWIYTSEGKHKLTGLPPCTFGQPIIDYLNTQEVRQKLHIPDHVQAWTLCTRNITYNKQEIGSQWAYEALRGKYRLLHYSGDTDGAVPTLGTMRWMDALGWEIKEPWRPYYLNGNVAGYIEVYDGVTLGTVHGAGHMAPQWRPPETYHLIFSFVKDTKP